MKLGDRHHELDVGLALRLLKRGFLIHKSHVVQVKELIGSSRHSTVQAFIKNSELKMRIKLFPFSLHLQIDFVADMLVGFHDGVPTTVLAQLLLTVNEAFACKLQESYRDGYTHEDHREKGRYLLDTDLGDEDAYRAG